jgi:Predicted xylanase/chitin deacetylase
MRLITPRNIKDAFKDAWRELQSIPKYVALTFDDGTANTQYNNIRYIIEKYRIPVTWFIETDPSGTRIREKYGEPAVAEPDQKWKIKELYDTGLVEIGSHTVTHPYLDTLTEEQLDYELSESKAYLEGIINGEVTSFAYPYGTNFDSREITFVMKYYKYARGVGTGSDWFSNFDEMPIRPSSPYCIRCAYGFEIPTPVVPSVVYYHNEDMSVIEPTIRRLLAMGAEFLKFSEFVEAVRRLPRLGMRIMLVGAATNVTSTKYVPMLGIFPGWYESIRVVANSPDAQIRIISRVDRNPEMGGFHVDASTWLSSPSFQQIYDAGGTDIWQVDKWDTTNNIYVISTKRRLYGKSKPAVHLVIPTTGIAMSVRYIAVAEI